MGGARGQQLPPLRGGQGPGAGLEGTLHLAALARAPDRGQESAPACVPHLHEERHSPHAEHVLRAAASPHHVLCFKVRMTSASIILRMITKESQVDLNDI